MYGWYDLPVESVSKYIPDVSNLYNQRAYLYSFYIPYNTNELINTYYLYLYFLMF